jgi:hypothetical protein
VAGSSHAGTSAASPSAARYPPLGHLGDALDAHGDPAGARNAWREAMAILADLGHPDAERLHAKIHPPASGGARCHPGACTADQRAAPG